MALPKKPKRSPAEGDLPFPVRLGGIPLFVRAARSLGVPAGVKRYLEVKQRRRGLDEAACVESFLVLNALGGECLDDFERLCEDRGLVEMLGHESPSPGAARQTRRATGKRRRRGATAARESC